MIEEITPVILGSHPQISLSHVLSLSGAKNVLGALKIGRSEASTMYKLFVAIDADGESVGIRSEPIRAYEGPLTSRVWRS